MKRFRRGAAQRGISVSIQKPTRSPSVEPSISDDIGALGHGERTGVSDEPFSQKEPFAVRQLTVAKRRFGSFTSFSTLSDHVGSYPNNDQTGDPPRRSKRANRDQGAPQQNELYSITSSAAFNRPSGTLRPSALAVLRLMTSSNFVPCTTGKSAGFSPLRIRPV
jgi:hypothetical protein